MSYNRTLDLLAVSLAATVAGLPVKAAKFMAEAAKDSESANAAIEAIYAANKKAKPKAKPKKKAKATFASAFADLEDDELPGEAETAADDEEVSDEEVMKLTEAAADEEDNEVLPTNEVAKRLRAALEGGVDADDADDEEEEVDPVQEARVKARMLARRKARANADGAGVEVDAPGDDEREEPQVSRETSRFAKTLRNLAARQNSK